MADQVSNRPEASLEELVVPMDAAVDMISCFNCTPRPWLVVVVMGQPFAKNLHVAWSSHWTKTWAPLEQVTPDIFHT